MEKIIFALRSCSCCRYSLHHSGVTFGVFFPVLQDFLDLLKEQAPLESYVEWLDKLVETKIIRVSNKLDIEFTKACRSTNESEYGNKFVFLIFRHFRLPMYI